MPNTITTPNMGLTIPSLNQSGPAYASEINADLIIVSNHDHDGSQYGGSLITINGQIINGDLSLDGYNLSNVRSTQYVNQPSVLVGSQDVNNVYVSNGNLYYNNADGIAVEITAGNTLAPTSNGPATNWSIRNITANATILPTDTYNCLDVDTTGGNIIIVLPIAAFITPSAVGRIYLVRMTNFASVHTITIQVAPGSGNVFGDTGQISFVLPGNTGNYVGLYTDGVSKWFTFSQSVYNGEILSLYNGSQLVSNGSTVSLVSSNLILDPATLLFADGGTSTFTAGTINFNGGASTYYSASSKQTFQSTSKLEIDSGATLITDAGSSLSINGTLEGITQAGGALTSLGTINLEGTTNIAGSGTTVTGVLNVTGIIDLVNGAEINLTTASSIIMDNTCNLTNNGLTNLYSTALSFANVSYGGSGTTTYTCDKLAGLDYVVRFSIIATCAFRLTLPANPVKGRTIIMAMTDNVSGFAADSWSIIVNGNGESVFAPDVGTLAATWTLTPSYFGGSYPSKNSDWSGSITWIFDGSVWIAMSVVL